MFIWTLQYLGDIHFDFINNLSLSVWKAGNTCLCCLKNWEMNTFHISSIENIAYELPYKLLNK